MSDDADTEAVLRLLHAGGAIPPPAVDPVRSVIRSGDQFLLSGQIEHSLTPQPPDAPSAIFIGALVVEWGYEVDYAQGDQYARWLADNERELADLVPEGVAYRGTYAVLTQTNLELGSYRTVWAYASLAALQAMDVGLAGGGRFAELLQEMTSFRDRRIGASRSAQFYQPAGQTRRV